MKKLEILTITIVLFAVVFVSCSPTEPTNKLPVIISLMSNPTYVGFGGTSVLTCTATDNDTGDELTYSWSSSGGIITGTSPSETWTAPDVKGDYTITCSVSDGTYLVEADIMITVYETIDGMVFIKGGSFEMGDHLNEGDPSELPLHAVLINDFYIGKYEVTQAEWTNMMGSNPSNSYGVGDNYPVYYVNWYDVIKYCNLRSLEEELTPCYTINGSPDPSDWGSVPVAQDPAWDAVICNWSANGYRLPTEAEWEYAARGGIHSVDNYNYSYCGSNILDEVGWYMYNADNTTHPVGTKPPNQLGLYDMSGNVRESCWDWLDFPVTNDYYQICSDQGTVIDPSGQTTGIHRSFRSGNFWNWGGGCRVACRGGDYPYHPEQYRGFRISRIP